MNQQAEVTGAVRIGNGTKLHLAYKHPVYGLIIRCGCPGTRQSSTTYRAQFIKGAQANCKN
jgi:hypothetical protein